jgi:hypothetical protein
MSNKRKADRASGPSLTEQARDELFSHIVRCGVTDAEPEHQKEWLDDTMQYLAERYPDLTETALSQVRVLGERFCKPIVRGKPETAGSPAS